MSQINLYQYAEIVKSDGSVEKIGSKHKPTTITLTGTGELIHQVWNDLPTTDYVTLYDDALTGLKWFAVKPSVEIQLAFGDESQVIDYTSAIVVGAGIWQFFNSGKTIEDVQSTVTARAIQGQVDITKIVAYNVLAADIEFIGAY